MGSVCNDFADVSHCLFFIVWSIAKQFDKSGFHQFIQLIQLLAALDNQVTYLVQDRRNFALFIKRWEGDFHLSHISLG